MMCPQCSVWSEVSETRQGQYFTVRRRRLCANGHRFTTVEIHAAAYGSVVQRLRVLAATISARTALFARNRQIRAGKDLGWQHWHREHGISRSLFFYIVKDKK